MQKEEQKPDCSRTKRGLVLQGGGAKGAYAYGCLLALHERGVQIDCVSGTSVGALNAALYSTNQLDRGGEIWGNLSQQAVYPYYRPPTLAKVIAPMLVVLHTVRAWIQGIELPDKVNKWLSFLICFPMLFAAHSTLAISVIQKRDMGSTIFWYCIFIILWLVWLKRTQSNRSSRIEILTELFSTGVIIIGAVALLDTRGITLEMAIYLLPLIVALCSWAVFVIAAVTNRTFLDSRPLKGIIAEVMSVRLGIPTYVTCAAARPVFDPDRPHYGQIPGKNQKSYFLDPVMTFVPRYHHLNKLMPPERNAALAASAALPLGIVKSVLVCGEICVDGGVIDNTPLFPLVSIEKCEELIVIELSPVNASNHLDDYYKMEWKRLSRQIVISDDVFQSRFDFKRPYQKRPFHRCEPPIEVPFIEPEHWPSRIITIAPIEPLGGFLSGTMNFTASYARRLIKAGYRDALIAIGKEFEINSCHKSEMPT